MEKMKRRKTMKKMISDMKAGEMVKTFLGVRYARPKISKKGGGYLEIKFYDTSGTITGYFFGECEEVRDVSTHIYVELTAMPKLYKGNLILQVQDIRVAAKDEFDMEEIFKTPSKEELQRIIDSMYPPTSWDRKYWK
jgi:hypothetical protein